MLKKIHFLFLYFISLTTIGQNIDSLFKVVIAHPSDSIEAQTYYHISNYYNNRNQLDSAIIFSDKSLIKSEKNNFEGITFSNKGLRAIVLAKKSKYQSADSLLTGLINEVTNSKLSDSSKQPHLLSIYITLGIINTINNHNSEALEYYLKGVNKAKLINEKGALAKLYNNIGNLYISEEDDSLAREYLIKAKNLYQERNNNRGLIKVYLNLGNINRYHQEFQEAITNYEASQKFALINSDSISYANAKSKTGLTYLELFENSDQTNNTSKEFRLLGKKGLLDKSLKLYLSSINILSKHNIPTYTSNNKIARIYSYQKKYREAITLYKNNFENLDLYSINDKIEAAEGLKTCYKKSNNFASALNWNEKLAVLNDSLNSRENLKEFGKKQAELAFIKTQEIEDLKHITEIKQLNYKNEKQQLIRQNEQRKQQYIIWTTTVASILIGAFLILIIRKWKITQKQKETINTQKLLIEKEKKATEDSINYARNIQKAAFPTLAEVKKTVSNNFILFNPKDIVSGDFYWTSQIGGKHFIALADCTGHGVPGAFMTLISLNILNQIIADGINTPATILEQLHLRLQKRLNNQNGNSSKHGLDIALCMIEDQKLTYAGVHVPIYHIRNSNLTEYKGQKSQLGSNGFLLFQQHEILIQKNDSFYISTDGFPDQKGGIKGKKYFYPTLRNKLTEIVNLELDMQRKELDSEFQHWKGDQEQLDDVSIIGFKF